MHWIKQYIAKTNKEAKDKEHLLQLPQKFIGTDRSLPYHYTTASLVMDKDKDTVLMIYHKIYNSWSWPGGHVEAGENLFYSALRELYEETGLQYVRPVSEAPFAMELMPVKKHMRKGAYVDTHFHINFCFGFFADSKDPLHKNKAGHVARLWIPVKELATFVTEAHMLPIYTSLIERLKSY